MPIDSTDPAGDAPDVPDPDAVGALGDHDDTDDVMPFEFDDEAGPGGDAALIARAKKKYGIGGAMLAGGMLGLDRMISGKVKPEAPVEWEAAGEPLDIDRKGIDVPLEDERIVRSRPGPPAAAGATSRRVTRRRRP